MTEIVTAANALSNGIPSRAFPVLEPGNVSFPDGVYRVSFDPGNDRRSFVVRHSIDGAPLITRLLEDGRARYVCILSSPVSSYRKTFVSSTALHQIQWDVDDLGEPPLFTPMIVTLTDQDLVLAQDRDGVHDIWDGATVRFPAGGRLAVGDVVELRASLFHLLSFRSDDTLLPGTFRVDTQSEPFQFTVKLSPDLHRFLQNKDLGIERKHIITHIVTACLASLQRDYAENDDEGGWQSYRPLVALAQYLQDNEIAHWADDDFHPELAATTLYPHILQTDTETSDES